MRIILDTNVLFEPDIVRSLAESEADLVLPAVAFAERARQILRAGRPIQELWNLLGRGEVQVEDFGPVQALQVPIQELNDRDWVHLARDAFIAGHVGPGDMLWTKDVEDFVAVGLPREQIQAI